MDASRQVGELAARESYGQLVALVASRTRDIAAAEDALSEAFSAALSQWPIEGVPYNPRGWLLTVARRRLIDAARHDAMRRSHAETIAQLARESEDEAMPDRRLRLMFACAHPGIDAAVRAPLMLQTILGLTAEQIGRAFLVSPAAMGQRLSRAKRKIRDAGVPLDTSPDAMEAQRLAIVCEAIYGAFSTGYNEDHPGSRAGLEAEAIVLARLVLAERSDVPEATGLLALMLFIHARRAARRDGAGRFVPLDEQDTALWDRAMSDEAAHLLASASRLAKPGRFQIEAAIQSVHAARVFTGTTNWPAIESLYRALLTHAPTLGARIAHLATLARAGEAETALAELLRLPSERVERYQPYWALRAHLEKEIGLDASASLERATGLTEDPAVRAFLRDRLSAINAGRPIRTGPLEEKSS